MDEHRHRPPMETFGVRDDSVLPEVVPQLRSTSPAGPPSTYRSPWRGRRSSSGSGPRLQDIPYGETTTYGELARVLGLVPGASRAVGLANGKNPISIIVPCHRVVGSTGSLTGYGGGLDRKQALLDHERADVLFYVLDKVLIR